MKNIIEYFCDVNSSIKYIIFSSVTSLIGAAAYSEYTAANSLCETVAAVLKKKHSADIKTLSWPLWLETSMAQHFNYKKLEHTLDFELFDTPKALFYFDWAVSYKKNGIYFGLRKDKYNIQKWINNIKYSDHFQLHVTNSDSLSASMVRKIQDTILLGHDNSIHRIKFVNSSCDNISHPKNNDIQFKLIDQLWRDNLKIRTPNYNYSEGFFGLGGSSLSAIKLIMDIQKTLDVSINMNDLISCEGANGLYEFIFLRSKARKSRKSRKSRKTSNLEVFHQENKFPLSIIQKQILYQCLLNENAAYNVYKIFRVNGPIENRRLKKCIDTLLNEFPIINMRLDYKGGEYFQYYSREMDPEHFSHLNCYSDEKAIEIIKGDIRRDFDLHSNSALYRIKHITISDSISFLLFNFHHLICDEWSLGIFFERFSALYEGENKSHEGFDYGYFVKNQCESVEPSERFMQQLVEYRPMFNNQSKRLNTKTGGIYTVQIPRECFRQIKEIAIKENITPAILCHAALNIAIQVKYDIADFNIGIPITFRSKSEHRNIFGCMVNTSVIGYKNVPNISINEYVSNIKEQYLHAQDNKNVPFSSLISECYSRTICARSELPFDVLFVYEDNVNHFSTSSFSVRETVLHNGTCKFPLTVALKFLHEDSPTLHFEYSKVLISANEVEDLSRLLLTLIGKSTGTPNHNLPISNFRSLALKFQSFVTRKE